MSVKRPRLGSDPELFHEGADPVRLVERGLDPALATSTIPAHFSLGMADGSEVFKLPHGDLRPDGLALEFTTDVAKTPKEMVNILRANILATQELVERNLGGRLSVNPRAYVAQEFIDMLPERYGKASSLQILGCAPDFNVYDLDVPEKPDPKRYQYRTSGGHIHIEIGAAFASDRAAFSYLTAALDAGLGATGTYLCTSEEAFLRKQMYGMAGMVRVPAREDGTLKGTIEYRTLPAQALIQTPEIAEQMFRTAQHIAGAMCDLYDSYGPSGQRDAIRVFEQCVGEYRELVAFAQAINNHSIDECREFQARFIKRFAPLSNLDGLKEMRRMELPNDFALHGW